jgi:hypothetical protein
MEEAAFAFLMPDADGTRFTLVEWIAIPATGFASRSGWHLELTDEMRARVIKRAHDLGACLGEFHSHRGRERPSFSPSDLLGFEEFVPHVWWRLKGRPYLAMVVSTEGLDGLVWRSGPRRPERLGGVLVDGRVLKCSHLSQMKALAND